MTKARMHADEHSVVLLSDRPELETGARELLEAMLDRAESLSYSTALLDVMPERIAAVRLRESIAFRVCPPYGTTASP